MNFEKIGRGADSKHSSETRAWRWIHASLALCWVLAAACGGSTGSSHGGETHWLSPCTMTSECGDGLACSCGVCTRPCSADAECTALGADAVCSQGAELERASACSIAELGQSFCVAEGSLAAGGSSGSGSGGASGGTSDGGGEAGAPAAGGSTASGGVAGSSATNGGGTGATGGDVECRPIANDPVDDCEYPESLGGAGDPTQCGSTPAAWYPLGVSDLTTWPEQARWASASGSGLTAALGADPSAPTQIAFDPEGRLVAAWLDEDLELRRWNGEAWDALPSNVPEPSELLEFAMVLDAAGNPVVLEHNVGTSRVVRWEDEGPVILEEWPAFGRAGRIVLDSEDRPVVVYVDVGERFNGCQLFAKRWNGSSFEDLSGSAADGSLHECRDNHDTFPQLALRENGDPVVAWIEWLRLPEDATDYAAVWLKQWSSDGWEELGGSATDAGVTPALSSNVRLGSRPTLAVDSADQIMVAWNTFEPLVRRWDGTAWLPPDEVSYDPRLYESPDGTIYLATKAENDIVVQRWNAGEWEPLVEPELPGDVSADWEVIAGDDGHLALVWDAHHSGWDALYLLVNTDGEWQELGEATASGAGLGPGPGLQLVSLDDGLFLHSYSDCLVSHWDGQSWENLELGNWLAPLGYCGGSTLTETPAGQPVLGIWVIDDLDRELGWTPDLYLLGWTGDDWEELTEPFHYDTYVSGLSVAFASSGAVFVAWQDVTYSDYPLRSNVTSWDGTEWAPARVVSTEYDSAGTRVLALPDDRMLLTWSYGTFFSIHEAGEWTPLPEIGGGAGVALDGEGTPFAYKQGTTDFTLLELVDSRWQRVPADEAHLSSLPDAVRLGASDAEGDIRVRRYEDCRWRGLSASDRGGGVSNSEAESRSPSLAVYDGMTCVVWLERAEYDPVRLLRCHD